MDPRESHKQPRSGLGLSCRFVDTPHTLLRRDQIFIYTPREIYFFLDAFLRQRRSEQVERVVCDVKDLFLPAPGLGSKPPRVLGTVNVV